MDHEPTEVTPHGDPTPVIVGAGDAEPALETRAERRARLEATLRHPVLPPLATVARPVMTVAGIVFASLLVLGLVADPVLLAAGLAWAGLVLAWGWPPLLGSSSRFGSSLAIGTAALLVPAAAAAVTVEPYLRLVPAALLVSLAVMFGHQIVRRDGRPRLTESLGTSSLAIALITMGAAWVPLARDPRSVDLALVAFVAIAVSSLGDVVAGIPVLRAWALPIVMALGGLGAVVAASVVGSPGTAQAALVGLLVAAVAHSLRRVLAVLPAISSIRGQVAAAAAGLLAPGAVVSVLSLAIVG